MQAHNQMVVPADRQSIFGDTYNGVPSPLVAHVHPYPTRFHGPVYGTPKFGRTYREQSWQVPSDFLAVNGFGEPALFGSATGNSLFDTLLGAGLGYVMAKNESDRLLWAGAGAAAGLLAGTLGIIGVIGAGVYVRR